MGRDSHDIEGIAADWLARRDGGPLAPGEEKALDAWLSTDARHRVAFLRLQAAWEESGRLQALAAGLHGHARTPAYAATTRLEPHGRNHDAAPGLEALEFKRRIPPRRQSLLMPVAVAAAVAIVAFGAGWFWIGSAGVEASSHRTAIGKVDTVPLADGSSTTLASDSRIEVRLSRRERRIELQQGEAFFEAARDPNRPFVVEVGGRRVVAVGTRFSVRREGHDLRVVVTEGVVRLESDAGNGTPQPAAMLPAGSMALARREGVLVRSLPLAEAEQMVDWRSGLLVFRDATLSEAAAEFNRYNVRKIVIADDDVGDLRIGGSFRWENAEAFVRLLEQGFPVRADYGDDRIVLHTP